jgi:hypothetical protein
MSTANNPIQPAGALPDHYQEVLAWKVTEKPVRVIALNIVGFFLFIFFGLIYINLSIHLGKVNSFSFNLPQTSLILIAVVLTLVLHELTHGLVMQLFGAKPSYGFIWQGLLFYATSPGHAYQRNSYLVIALAPFILITMLTVLGMWVWQGTIWVVILGICGIINASGAVGDLWLTMIVLRYANSAYVIDEKDGIRVFLPAS